MAISSDSEALKQCLSAAAARGRRCGTSSAVRSWLIRAAGCVDCSSAVLCHIDWHQKSVQCAPCALAAAADYDGRAAAVFVAEAPSPSESAASVSH